MSDGDLVRGSVSLKVRRAIAVDIDQQMAFAKELQPISMQCKICDKILYLGKVISVHVAEGGKADDPVDVVVHFWQMAELMHMARPCAHMAVDGGLG